MKVTERGEVRAQSDWGGRVRACQNAKRGTVTKNGDGEAGRRMGDEVLTVRPMVTVGFEALSHC